ncbi:hypothetical protein [Malaciobacter marinus]|uniref:Uncharacterized protein n=2 Tax=Malaciobacter marinus TaxID=505249 RepID=A0ABX4LZY1_9BACT|nr:hypothetical protein [Malaciobacter marinus]PHO16200.1 hypothetical protein CPH92_02530 [Malaciobacter marinus]
MSSNNLKTQIISAKEQVQRVASIQGIAPETLNACATYFNDEQVLTYLQDPESINEKIIHVNQEKFADSLYKPLFLMRDATNERFELRREDGFNYYSIDLEAKGLNLRVGVDEEVHDLIMQKEFSSLNSISKQKFKKYSNDMVLENYSVGLDGIVVKYRDY